MVYVVLLLTLSFCRLLSMEYYYPTQEYSQPTASLHPHQPTVDSLTAIQSMNVARYSFDHLGHKPLGLAHQDIPNKCNTVTQSHDQSVHSVMFEQVVLKLKKSLDHYSNTTVGYRTNNAIKNLSEEELNELPLVIVNHCLEKSGKIINPALVDRLALHFNKLFKEGVDIFNSKTPEGVDIFSLAVAGSQINVVQALIRINEKMCDRDTSNYKKLTREEIQKILVQNKALYNYFQYNVFVQPKSVNIILQTFNN